MFKMSLIVLAACLAAGGGVALAASPKPGNFKGHENLPGDHPKTQPLEFTMGGDGHKIYAFDVPSCTEGDSQFFPRRVVRPHVSAKGHISGKLSYRKTGKYGNTSFRVHVSGEFVTPRRAKGKLSLKATRTTSGPLPQVLDTCMVKGSWAAKHE